MEIKVNFKLGGIGTVLTIIFAVLKLTGVVSWSWFICFLPLIIGAVLTLILFGVMFVMMFCTGPADFRKTMKEDKTKEIGNEMHNWNCKWTAQQKAKEDDTPAWKQPATYDEQSYEPDPEPEQQPSQGGGGNDDRVYTAEDEAARAEGYANAADKRALQEYAEKYYPGQEVRPATEDDLREWGLL